MTVSSSQWIAGWSLLLLSGCGNAPRPTGIAEEQWVFVDTATRKTFLGQPTAELPAIHPETGKRTLMPGLYCPRCQEWYPAPPLEVRQRNPESLRCPKSGDLMTAEGPVPTAE